MDDAIVGGNFKHYNTEAPESKHVLPLFSLKGKTAIISGAGQGIGLAVARGYAEAGANVAIWFNSNKKAFDRAEEIEKEFGVKCQWEIPQSDMTTRLTVLLGRAYQVDVRDAKAVDEAIVSQTKEFNNRLDIFVANAGIPWTQGPMIGGELEHFQNVMKIDVDGVFYCARTAGRIWREQKKNKLKGFSYGKFIATAVSCPCRVPFRSSFRQPCATPSQPQTDSD